MNPTLSPEPRNPTPCPHHAPRATRRADAGLTRLEFALAVIVAGVMASLALERIAELQQSAHDVSAETSAAQQRAVAAQAEARETLFPPSAASTPRPASPSLSPTVP